MARQSKKQKTVSNKLGQCSTNCAGLSKGKRKTCLRDCMKGGYKWSKAAKKRSGRKKRRR